MKEKKEISTIDELLEAVRTYISDESEIETIKEAYEYAKEVHKGTKRLSGEDYILHPLNVAYILTSLNADSDTIATALLHDVIHKGNANIEDIREKFGDESLSHDERSLRTATGGHLFGKTHTRRRRIGRRLKRRLILHEDAQRHV